jgi:hypothetical protein
MALDSGNTGCTYAREKRLSFGDNECLFVSKRVRSVCANRPRQALDLRGVSGIAEIYALEPVSHSVAAGSRLSSFRPRAGTLLCVLPVG